MFENLDIILYAILAVFLFIKLRNILGVTDDESEEQRKSQSGMKQAQPTNVVHLSKENVQNLDEVIEAVEQKPPFPDDLKKSIKDGLEKVVSFDKNFTYDEFMTGAGKAFEFILRAFAKGDKKMLKDLLNKELYDEFSSEIDERKNRNEVLDTTLVSIQDCTLTEAKVLKTKAQLTVKFITEQINLTKDPDGKVTAGDPNKIETIEDIWTFHRNLKSANPNWELTAIQND